jgi:hypothetical protein
MSSSSSRARIGKVLCVVIVAAIGFGLASAKSFAQQEERWKLFVTPPENARRVWYLQARHVATELGLEREDSMRLARAYASARQEHLEKVQALPQTPESGRQFWELRGEASSALEKTLVEAFGEEKGKKAAVALGAFNFLADNMAADILAAQEKALASVFDYQASVNKVVKEASDAGSWEGIREKFTALTGELFKKISAIFSEKQLGEWQEKYRPVFEPMLSE